MARRRSSFGGSIAANPGAAAAYRAGVGAGSELFVAEEPVAVRVQVFEYLFVWGRALGASPSPGASSGLGRAGGRGAARDFLSEISPS